MNGHRHFGPIYRHLLILYNNLAHIGIIFPTEAVRGVSVVLNPGFILESPECFKNCIPVYAPHSEMLIYLVLYGICTLIILLLIFMLYSSKRKPLG